MTELEKMEAGAYYDFSAPEIVERSMEAHRCLERLHACPFADRTAYREALAALIPGLPASSQILTPFFCDYGFRIRIGEDTFVNAGVTMLDSGGIAIGSRTKIGPGCHLLTPHHPLDHLERRRPVEQGRPIVIGDDCWLGGNVTVCPGVRIGHRTVVAAGSVVTRDLPDDVLAAGNPATVKRKLR